MTTDTDETLPQVEMHNMDYPIGLEVYIPEKNIPTKTKIIGYSANIIEQKGKLVGIVTDYRIHHGVSLRRGAESDLVCYVKHNEIYTNPSAAEAASRFLEVQADEEIWRLAIGDRKVKDTNSPYHIDNSGLPICCGNISDARDILAYCKNEGGLIVFERDQLGYLLKGHEHPKSDEEPLGSILKQLEIIGG